MYIVKAMYARARGKKKLLHPNDQFDISAFRLRSMTTTLNDRHTAHFGISNTLNDHYAK